MRNGIENYIVNYNDFLHFLEMYIKRIYEMDENIIRDSINHFKKSFFDFLKARIKFYVEFPYVDKLYRNSYYHYYASKNFVYPKDTIRVSLFSDDLPITDLNSLVNLQNHYLGFFVIRPTTSNFLGRNIINPKAFEDSNYEIVKSKFTTTANYCKLFVEGFPHSSQDTETITCAETSVWSIIEYFSNK